MKYIILFIALLISSTSFSQKNISAMLITSQRKVPVKEFYAMFDNIPELVYTEVLQPKANEDIEHNKANNYDILIFYDLNDSITQRQKEAYWQLLQNGKPMLFLHHTLVSYQKWPEFIHIIGGRYYRDHPERGPSTFEHDIDISIEVINNNHPICNNLNNFTIHDETYNNCFILPDVTPLLTTSTPINIPYPAWIHKVKNAEVVYIQFGQDENAFTHPEYQKLIEQSINYLTKSN
ncbi:ThuA domain-containing protein [Carboxylicivirga linearis]|uniref:ThuA domain-containing protein n=1 Tax=Carboxylicivirga linearis TaxID=1628157 RepID=A0ABS5JV67_9BACT|nr:ThuA domain-containing protein [Carboxylicivirga linearis]MBS2098804.1 ThuA domain-containing protein [Carboxylicivirga linearis]